MDVSVGIDTSCYTTSVAALDLKGNLLADARIPLAVKSGNRGLSQSEMVFQHVRNIPAVIEKLRKEIGRESRIVMLGASARPRSVNGSYMPVFLVGLGSAKAMGAVAGCPVFELSHQENHVLAGVWSVGGDFGTEFLAVHASGGTTELLFARQEEKRFWLEKVGGTRDLHAGQFVDRVGVALGLPFPAGPHLEKLADSGGQNDPKLSVSVVGTEISFSGPESQVKRWLSQSPPAPVVAASVQRCIAESLRRALISAVDLTGAKKVLLVGGVSANRFIRAYIVQALQESRSVPVFCPAPEFSGDNAVGAACWALTHKTG